MPNLSSHIQTFSVLDAPYAGNDMQFEALDGFIQNLVGGASITFNNGAWRLDVGPAVNDYIQLIKRDQFPLYDYTWDKRRQFKLKLSSQIPDDPIGEFYVLCGDPYAPWRGFGLVFTATKITARVGDGVNYTDLDLFTGLTPMDTYVHLYEFVYYPGNGVYITVDGIAAGSITTNLPTGTTSAEKILEIDLTIFTDTYSAELGFSRILFSQDK